MSVYEQTVDFSSYRTDGRASKQTGTENLIGEFLQVRLQNSPKKE
jgi:hypothetical protein